MLKAKVRATVTIEFDVGNWNTESCFSSIHKKVSDEAKTILQNRMKGTSVSIIDKPEIKVITFTESA